MAQNPYELLLGVLAVWRITHLIQAEDGPWDLVARLRARAGAGWVAAVPNPGVSHGHGGTSVSFVYDGVAGVIVTGHATGRRYRVGERGARLVVDARDARFLDATPKLRRVSP